MRIYVGGISNESNSFSPVLMTCKTFQQAIWYVGRDVAKIKTTSKETRGTYDYLEAQPDVELVPGFVAHGQTSGPVRAKDYAEMKQLILDTLRSSLPVDGVVLNMHGAMQAEDCFDCEGDLFTAVREMIGPDIPLTSSFDLHAAVTPQMVEQLDGMAAFQTYPHTDHARAGYDAAKAVVQLVREKIRPKKLYKYLPMIMAVENCNTDEGPVCPAIAMIRELLEQPGVLSGALNLTQPWLDVPDLGCMVTLFVRPDADTSALEAKMDEILNYLWEKRDDFIVEIPPIKEVLEESKHCRTPVCVVELGDIVSAGGVGDSTEGLRALLADPSLRPASVTVCDPESVRRAIEIGEGNEGDFQIGGIEDHGYNTKTPLHAKIIRFNSDRVMPTGETEKGVAYDLGTRVLLQTRDGLYVTLCENSCTNHDAAMMRTMGLEPADMKIIMQKTHQMFKAGYADVMGSFLYADTPGFTDRNLRRLPFKNIRHPLYPVDSAIEVEQVWKGGRL